MSTSAPQILLRNLISFCVATVASASVAVAQQQPNPPTNLTVDGGVTVPGGVVFSDSFEFDASRSGASRSLVTARGWGGVKAENFGDTNRAYGYIYTQPDATLGSQVLVLESRPSTAPYIPGFPGGQTDYYLQYGTGSSSTDTIPGNVWIQFWTYATPESRFAARDKTLYATRDTYPSSDYGWMVLWGRNGYEKNDFLAPLGARFIGIFSDQADYRVGYDPGYDSAGNHKLFQNVSQTPMLVGRWYQVKLHFDTSGSYINPTNGQPAGMYEAWIRERGQANWTKVADFRPGVTGGPNGLYWPLDGGNRAGHRAVRLPTTVNEFDNTVLIDDFVISSREP